MATVIPLPLPPPITAAGPKLGGYCLPPRLPLPPSSAAPAASDTHNHQSNIAPTPHPNPLTHLSGLARRVQRPFDIAVDTDNAFCCSPSLPSPDPPSLHRAVQPFSSINCDQWEREGGRTNGGVWVEGRDIWGNCSLNAG